jgi:hypothetical protein
VKHAASLALVLATVCRADVVERRGGQPPLEGEVTGVDEAGVTVKTAGGASLFAAWDRVRDVESARAWPRLAEYLEAAADLWRARSRVERGDTALAEPLLERLFERTRGQTHTTALVVAEGLLRCRIARSEQVLAVVPALEAARLRRRGVTSDAYSALDVDAAYALCTALPPVFVPSPALEALARDLEAYDARGDRVVAALGEGYRRAALRGLGREAADAFPAGDEPGVELLRRMDACLDPDPARRAAAREALRRAMAAMPPWAEAWARYQLGVAGLEDASADAQQEGAVSLIHVPARFGRAQPYLAGLSLDRVARYLERTGDAGAAAALREELARRYGNHPVLARGPAVPLY